MCNLPIWHSLTRSVRWFCTHGALRSWIFFLKSLEEFDRKREMQANMNLKSKSIYANSPPIWRGFTLRVATAQNMVKPWMKAKLKRVMTCCHNAMKLHPYFHSRGGFVKPINISNSIGTTPTERKWSQSTQVCFLFSFSRAGRTLVNFSPLNWLLRRFDRLESLFPSVWRYNWQYGKNDLSKRIQFYSAWDM